MTADQADVIEIQYDVDEACRVTGVTFHRVGQQPFRRDNGYGHDNPPIVARRPNNDGDVTAQTHIIYGNYVHTSQTVQDAVNIDIAKLQYHTDRNWDYSCTWWQPDLWGRASTSVRWNHPEDIYIHEVLGTRCGSDWTRTGLTGVYRSDWLWCNFTASWQRLYLYNYNYSGSDGNAGATWLRNVECPGTHVATRLWQNTNREG